MSSRQNHQNPLEVSHQFASPYEGGLPPIFNNSDAMNTMNNPYGHLPPGQQSQQLQPLPPPQPPQQPHPQQLQQTQPPPQPQQQQHSVDALKPYKGRKGGFTYSLVVRQEPIRARMCGFGDKDRRPITPPPCIRLCITDQSGKEVNYTEIESSFFVLTVDLWGDHGEREVSLVRHAGGTPNPSISNSTLSPFPPQPERTMYGPSVPAYLPPSQSQPPIYGQPPPPMNPGYYPNHPGYQAVPPAPSYPPPSSAPYGANPQMYMGQPHYPPAPVPVMAQVVQVQHTPSSSTGMYTRNLIGSLSVNASKLVDDKKAPGLWFVLQDLSVRTEGVFRLKMNFVDVGSGQSNTLNKGKAPVLATCFSAPFQVYSAKKFPGVIESTPLSKVFAQQGIKIPIRKDQAKALSNQAEYDADDQ